MGSSWGCSSELSCPCGGSARAAALQGWVENQQPRKTPELLRQWLGGGWKKQTPVGFQGSVISPDLSAECRVLWDVPSAKTPGSALPPKHQFFPQHLLSILDTQQFLWPPRCNVDGIFGGVSSHLLQNVAFSFPYGHRAVEGREKEMITRGLLRLGWSQLTQEDEELTSHWALPILVPFLELDRGSQTGVWGFFLPKNCSDTHTELAPYGRHLLSFLNSRAPAHKDPEVPLATEKLNLSCGSL